MSHRGLASRTSRLVPAPIDCRTIVQSTRRQGRLHQDAPTTPDGESNRNVRSEGRIRSPSRGRGSACFRYGRHGVQGCHCCVHRSVIGSRDGLAIVGPASPHVGGIVDHTAALARRLADASLLDAFVSWDRLFPASVHPATRRWSDSLDRRGTTGVVEADAAFPHVPLLRWDRPGTWFETGDYVARRTQRLVMVLSSPLQMPAIRIIASRFRASCAGEASVTIIVHNVLPHERHPFNRHLQRSVIRSADRVIVHSSSDASRARELGAHEIRSIALPFHPPVGLAPTAGPRAATRHQRLAMLGFVRPYKGLDVLLQALARSSSMMGLTVRGEFWQPIDDYRRIVSDLGLEDRVSLEDGHIDGAAFATTLAAVDALVLPYRSATASQMPLVAFSQGVPVIASDAGGLADQVDHGRNGLVCPAGDVDALAAAIDDFATDDRWLELRRGVQVPDIEAGWASYLEALR